MPQQDRELTREWLPTFWAFSAAFAAVCEASLALLHAYTLLADAVGLNWRLGVETALAAGLDALGVGYLGRARIAMSRDALIVSNVLRTHVIPFAEIESVTGSLWGLAIARTGHPRLLAVALPASTRAVRAGVHTREGGITHAIRHAARLSELSR
ncbi:hypothetical protein [Actinospica robiniae]|uniref:hypothetical protein n=1 Tax=Actinospica robiniae TaxID=304901 RepID=UPI0003FE085F|nr:hypothetical protein [Actinospica robiniae]